MQRRTTSTTLRNKLDSIADLPATVRTPDNQALKPSDPIRAITRQVEARLWGTLQRTLFDRRATRKLEPLTVSCSGSSFDSTFSEGMLEDLLVSSCETELKSSSGVEDVDFVSFFEFIDGKEAELCSDTVDAARLVDDDELLDHYQDEEYATGRVTLGDAEPLYNTRDLKRQIGRIDYTFTGDLCEEGEDSRQDLGCCPLQ